MSRSRQALLDSIPAHLRQFVATQHYQLYSPQDHAVWRFLMHQLAARLRDTAHPVYREGLLRTGISLEHIPSMEEMNDKLAAIGWRAVVVDGVIPSAIFMEFQARRILPIARDMRDISHMLYTPAPDIVHEAAGHAPFIVDTDYTEFLQRFGEVGMKALSTQADIDVFHAVRQLSILKESRDSSAAQIAEAEARLRDCHANNPFNSEAALLARLHWWTVEYGLVGEVDNYRLFGAGLLSSLGESINCLDDVRVPKRMLSLEAINTAYDITREQPQLFVTRSCQHLCQVLEAYARRMAFAVGGASSLRKAIDCASVATAELSSGLQISGVMDSLIVDAAGNESYLRCRGPTQLAYRGRELPGQGIAQHPEGFGAPLGQVQDMPRCLSDYTVDELKGLGIAVGKAVALDFVSGVKLRGELREIVRRDRRNLIFRFSACRVSGADGECLFAPEWGDYDMAIGESVVSVYGGSADLDRFPIYRHHLPDDSLPEREGSAAQQRLMALYGRLRELRESGGAKLSQLLELREALAEHPDEWLIRFELLELLPCSDGAYAPLLAELKALGKSSAERRRLVDMAVQSLEMSQH